MCVYIYIYTCIHTYDYNCNHNTYNNWDRTTRLLGTGCTYTPSCHRKQFQTQDLCVQLLFLFVVMFVICMHCLILFVVLASLFKFKHNMLSRV